VIREGKGKSGNGTRETGQKITPKEGGEKSKPRGKEKKKSVSVRGPKADLTSAFAGRQEEKKKRVHAVSPS